MGSAYRTSVPATVYTTEDDDAAVYAVFPEVAFIASSTPYVIVATSISVQDTVIHPCDENGQMLGFDLIAIVVTTDHAVALRDVGYELEAVVSRGA